MAKLEIKKPSLTPLKEKKETKKEEEESKGLSKSTFLYMEPKGDTNTFAQCKNCWKWTGKTCLEFSSKDKVGGGDSCGLFNYGKPSIDRIGKEINGTTPKEAGFVEGNVRCENCEYFEKSDGDCLLFRLIGIKEYKVHPKACCNAFSKR